ncbi:unnamed protein product [Brassica rapa subsp. trilocularis]|uniref:(rape) hypothetical protein n=1 Tax=Brassica napus TaxID=3708 RepID=A0A078GJR7_BRANA|nr:unnamed protein product [Brassica napus]CDY25586.1 BnaA04g12780D [Brassica napus]
MVSMEALAMAGTDYQEWGLSVEEWEFQESVVPPHLLADDSEKDEEEDYQNEDDRVFDGVEVKQSLTCDIRASVGKLIEESMSHIIVHLKLLKFLRHLLENFLFSHVLDFIL